MLRATVSLSRRSPRGDSPSEFAVSLDGEILATPDDHEAVLERIGELFDLAEEALAREIEETKPTSLTPTSASAAAPNSQSSADAATSKQMAYLHKLVARKGISTDGLAAVIARVLGRTVPLGELTRQEAGRMIDHLAEPVAAGK
ncbi:MAG: hypothetical protein K8U57_04115 [Planctomycetes bacterium]|nr:hypothetical protein [Planctomycetota bacterium]